MNKEEFYFNVRKLTPPADYENLEHLLEIIPTSRYKYIIRILAIGVSAQNIFKELDNLVDFEKRTGAGEHAYITCFLAPKMFEYQFQIRVSR